MAAPIKSLKRADGTVVTAQEAHDAFMNTRVLIVASGTVYKVTSMMWYDNNSEQNDPTNVGYVEMCYVYNSGNTPGIDFIGIGDSSLVPA